jgi:putative peptidoglycan binding protein
MAAKPIGHELYSMKKINLLSLVSIALVGLAQPTWAGPHGGGGGFAGGGHFGGGGHFSGGGHFGGGFRAAPAFSSGGARFGGRSVGGLARGPQFYYGGGRMSAVRSYGFTGSARRPITSNAGRRPAITHQLNRGSMARTSGVQNSRISAGSNRQSSVKNHAFTHHDANWHRDWDRRHAHFDHGHVFVFADGFWWGLDPGSYPFDAYADGSYPYDYYSGYPSDYNNGYPSDYNGNYDGDNGYYDDPGYGASDQYGNNETVSAVQSQLAKLGYYRGAIDGTLGDETEDAIARYEEDHDLSVTGTITAAALQSLGLARGASY